ncbi:GNAT family N-acetyltransferase [Modestobacter versicolor]|uniref:GNAT family N-acetyltransferase n=1 Tax=Modestobacter versicolor TaxID=429133 RepID=UPI0034DF8F32
MEPVSLPVGELLLRPWREDDVDAVQAAVRDPLLQRWNDLGSRTPEGLREKLARFRDWTAGDHCSWAVEEGGTLVGSVALHSIDRAQVEAELGYWTTAGARGRGVAVRAADAACRWAFAELGLDRVQLFHAVENAASGRVAEKAGFTLEGRLRRSHRYGDGVKHDELLWSRLSDDPPPALR